MSPVVFVSIPSGVSAGNILRGGLIDRLLEANRDVQVVVVSPLVRDAAFVQEFKRPRVAFEDLPPHMPSGLEGRLMALIQAGYLDSGVSESVKIRRAEAIAKKSIRWIRTKRLLAGLLNRAQLRHEPGKVLELAPELIALPRRAVDHQIGFGTLGLPSALIHGRSALGAVNVERRSSRHRGECARGNRAIRFPDHGLDRRFT